MKHTSRTVLLSFWLYSYRSSLPSEEAKYWSLSFSCSELAKKLMTWRIWFAKIHSKNLMMLQSRKQRDIQVHGVQTKQLTAKINACLRHSQRYIVRILWDCSLENKSRYASTIRSKVMFFNVGYSGIPKIGPRMVFLQLSPSYQRSQTVNQFNFILNSYYQRTQIEEHILHNLVSIVKFLLCIG